MLPQICLLAFKLNYFRTQIKVLASPIEFRAGQNDYSAEILLTWIQFLLASCLKSSGIDLDGLKVSFWLSYGGPPGASRSMTSRYACRREEQESKGKQTHLALPSEVSRGLVGKAR